MLTENVLFMIDLFYLRISLNSAQLIGKLGQRGRMGSEPITSQLFYLLRYLREEVG